MSESPLVTTEQHQRAIDVMVELCRDVSRLSSERETYHAKLKRVLDLLHEWEHSEYSATEVEPGIAYCAKELRRVLLGDTP